MEEIVALLNKSIKNYKLETNEKKAIKAKIKVAKLNKRDLDYLRSQIFDIAIANQDKLSKPELIEWIESCNKLSLPKKTESNDNYAFFSPGEACRSAITSKIKTSRNTLKICVFTISDNEISDEIIRAHKRGVSVKIISDNDKSFDMGSDIEQFEKTGIRTKVDKSDSHMHHKFCLIDQESLITGSYNWTRSAAERNQENIIISKDSSLIRSFNNEFEKLWEHLVDY